MRLVVVADGDPLSQSTNSGVARGISRALDGQPGVEVVALVNSRLAGWRRVVLAGLTVRPTRQWWWSTFNFGLLNMALRSRHRDNAVSRLVGDVDYIVQVRNVYFPSRFPYLVFIDSTTEMANEGWKQWRPTWVARRLRKGVERAQYRKAAHVFTAGPQAARSVHESYGVPESRVTAIGGGLNFDEFPEPVERSPAKVKNILFVGTDFERKGGDLLVEAFCALRESYPDLTLTIVGPASGDALPGVRYVGRIDSREEMATIFRSADIFCHPARHEPYGLVLQEAMAFGLPCIATRVGALGTIVSDGVTGLLIPSDDVPSLAAAIESLVQDPQRARLLGSDGRERVLALYTWRSVAERMIAGLNGAVELGADTS